MTNILSKIQEEVKRVNTLKYNVYKISYLVNNKEYFYIGRTKNINKRIEKHFYLLKNNKHYNNDMQLLFNCCINSLRVEVIFTTDDFRKCKIVEKEMSCNINCINISGLSNFYRKLANDNLENMRREVISKI